MKEITCKYCGKAVLKSEHRQKFCSKSCSGYYSNKHRQLSEESKQKSLDALKKYGEENPTKPFENACRSSKGKFYGDIKSILDVSTRTAHKIIKRIGLGCCVCGWNESTCDIHHINGKKVNDPNGHWNLTLLCPNHHRMYHNKKIKKEDIKTLEEYFPKNWNDFYYG